MHEALKPVTLLLSAMVALVSLTEGHARDLTEFKPEIVIECRRKGTAEVAPNCQLFCHNTSVTVTQPGSPSVTWPGFGYRFSRIEFYARDNRPSENWLVALEGSQTGDVSGIAPYVSFLTIGASSICRYMPGDPALELKLVKHY